LLNSSEMQFMNDPDWSILGKIKMVISIGDTIFLISIVFTSFLLD